MFVTCRSTVFSGYVQVGGYRVVLLAGGHQAQDLELPWGESVHRDVRVRPGQALDPDEVRLGAQFCEHPTRCLELQRG